MLELCKAVDPTFDEKVDPDLRVTKVVLEIDTRTGPYQACNICVDGKDPVSNFMAGGAAASSGDDDGKPCQICNCIRTRIFDPCNPHAVERFSGQPFGGCSRECQGM